MAGPRMLEQEPVSPHGRSQVLVLRPGAIGDTILTVPALRALRRGFPGADLHLVGNPAMGHLLVRAGIVDRFTDFDSPTVSPLFVPRLGLDRYLFGPPVSAAVAWCADPEGNLRDNLRELGASWVVVAPSRPPDGLPVHVSDHLLESLGLVDAEHFEDCPLLEALGTAECHPQVDSMPGLSPGARYVVIHPGSGSPRKNWPPEHFARLADIIYQQLQGSVELLMVVGPADGEACQTVHRLTKSPLRRLYCPSLLPLAGVLARCLAYVGNDSGITHLAAAVGAPTLAIFGPTDPEVWGPRGRWVWTIRAEPLSSLAPDEVARRALPIIEGRSRGGSPPGPIPSSPEDRGPVGQPGPPQRGASSSG